ncbi:MAG: RHS repeat-associated core domain-containing protein [Pseudohongiellaceae bacterium]
MANHKNLDRFSSIYVEFSASLIAVLGVVAFILSQAASAHTLNTNTLTISNPDDENENPSFVLLDPGGFNCPTTVSVTVDPATALKVTPAGPIEVVGAQLFVVTALQGAGVIPLQIKITVKWKHGPAPMIASDPCYRAMDAGEAAEGEEEITVTVSDILTAFNESQANKAQAAQAGDPVNTESGELFFNEEPDLRYSYNPMPLVFQRYYAAHLKRWLVVGKMGDNWRHTYEWTLRNVGNTLQIVDHVGRQTKYLKPDTTAGDWVQQNNSDVPLAVIQTTDGETIWSVFDARSGYTYVFSVPGTLSEFKLTSIEDGKGNRQSLSYNDDGLLTGITDVFGRSIVLSYDEAESNAALKKVVSITDGTRTVSYSYEGDNLTTVLDANGGSTRYEYDTSHADPGLLKRKIWPLGNSPWTQTFDDRGRVATQADSFGNVASFAYANSGSNITTLTRPDGLTETHEHSEEGALTKSIDAANNTSTVTNTSSTARNKITLPDGGSFSSTYDSLSGKVASETFAGGQTTQYGFTTRTDSRGFPHRDLTTITYPDGSTQLFSFDASGNRLSKTTQDGYRTVFEYDGFGNLTKSTNALGGATSYSYDGKGNLVSTTDPAGNVTTTAYDQFDRVVSVTRADGAVREFTYDALNRRTTMTVEGGGKTTFAYDANGNLLSVTDPTGNTSHSVYDGNNNLTSFTDRLGNTTRYEYDKMSRLVKASSADGKEENHSYSPTGETVSVNDTAGRSNNLTYDSANRLTAAVDAAGNSTTYVRDLQGQIISSTTPEGNTTSYQYDSLGRLVKTIEPSGKTTTNTFEKSGWIRSITLGTGASTLMERNGLGQIERFTAASGGVWTYSYDSSGRVVKSTDPLGNATTHSYDNRNRLNRSNYPGSLGGVSYSYNPFGHITQRAWDGGLTINDTYDSLGRLTATDGVSISYDKESRIIESNGLGVTRDNLGRVTSSTLAPGKSISYKFDPTSGELLEVTDWAGSTTVTNRDERGNLREVRRGNNRVTSFTYDSQNRNSRTDHGFSSHEVTRNTDGQVASVERVQALDVNLPKAVNYTYDSADRIKEFTYDGLGRLTFDGARNYSYDGASRLTRVISAGIVSYEYNGFGHMTKRTKSGNTREYVWNHTGSFPVVSAIKDNGADTRYFVHTPGGRLLYSIDAVDNSRLYYHYDERGNTVALSDDAGVVVATYAYGPYGTISASSEIDNPFTFGGLYAVISDSLGFYHMQRRVMDPATGRFLTPEPIMPLIHPQNSIYGYAANDPINFIDPAGTTPTAQDAGKGFLAAGSSGTGIAGIAGDIKATGAAKLEKQARTLIALANSVGSETPGDINAVVKAVVKGEKALETANDLNRASKPLQAAGKLGKGFQAVDIALTMKKLHTELGKASEDFDAATKGAIKSFFDRTRTVHEIYRKKKKTLIWLEAMLEIQYLQFQLDLINSDYLYDIELALDVTVAFANGLGSFVPFFTGLDPDAGNNVGFFFQ